MIKIKGKGLRILKFFHLLCVMCWAGGIICSFGLLIQSSTTANRENLIYLFSLMEFLDYYFIISGALATIVVGVIYAICTNWGFIKIRWIAIKWILSWVIIITGSVFYLPFVEQMQEIIAMQGLAAMKTPAYTGIYQNFVILFISHMALVIIMILLSTIKPKLEIKKKPRIKST